MKSGRLDLMILSACFLSACATLPSTSVPGTKEAIVKVAQHQEQLSVLSMTGGLCLVAGMALLVITNGTKGWYPTIGGLLMVILNYMIARYSHYLFIPAVVCTGLISAAWTYKTIREILLEKKNK